MERGPEVPREPEERSTVLGGADQPGEVGSAEPWAPTAVRLEGQQLAAAQLVGGLQLVGGVATGSQHCQTAAAVVVVVLAPAACPSVSPGEPRGRPSCPEESLASPAPAGSHPDPDREAELLLAPQPAESDGEAPASGLTVLLSQQVQLLGF